MGLESEDSTRVDPPALANALVIAEAFGACVHPVHYKIPLKGCSCGNAGCERVAKHPIGNEWQKLTSSAEAYIRLAFARHPHANAGVATGVKSGIVVVDIDGPDGEASLAALEAKHGALPPCPQVRTARGRHLYFAAGTAPIKNSVRKLGPGLDVRGEGGQVVAPGSVHESGFVYHWIAGHGPSDLAPPPLPVWLVAELAAPPPRAAVPEPPPSRSYVGTRAERYAAAAFDREVANVRNAPKGTRNRTLNAAAFNLGLLAAGGALDASEAKRALRAAAIENGLSELETVRTITSAWEGAKKGEARSGPTRDLPRTTGAPHAAPPSSEPEPEGPSDATVKPLPSKMQPRYKTAALFAPLPEQRWAVPGLQLGPGRPTLIAGYGASAKTISIQSFALSLAAGRAIWGHFECSPLKVLHVDYEQTMFATAKRYQRLALGHGISIEDLEGRLEYIEMPRAYLDEKDGLDQYLEAIDGWDVVIIDALRGMAPHSDENDSSFRGSIDRLTYASQRTGASIILLHHAAKPKKDSGDARTIARGSSAIFDASGCVLNFIGKPGESARLVQQVKMPAEAEGAALDPFELVVEDVNVNGNGTGGVRVLWRQPVPVDENQKAAEAFEKDAAHIMKAVRRAPDGQSTNTIVARCGVGRSRALDVLKALADEGRLEIVAGPRRSRIVRIPAGGNHGSED